MGSQTLVGIVLVAMMSVAIGLTVAIAMSHRARRFVKAAVGLRKLDLWLLVVAEGLILLGLIFVFKH